MKHHLIHIYIMLLACHISLFASVHKKDTILSYDKGKLHMEIMTGKDGLQYTRLNYSKLNAARDAGHPELPHQHITLSIPENATNVSLNIETKKPILINLSGRIYPIQRTKTTSKSRISSNFTACDSTSYSNSKGFPEEVAFITDISGYTDKEKQVGIDIYPIKYFSTNNKCELYSNIILSVTYELLPTQKNNAKYSLPESTNIPYYEYCIITSRNLEKAFGRLQGWIRQKGKNAGIVCLEDIVNDPSNRGDTISDLNDNAGKIRQYLQNGYKYGGTKYVLFGGNDSIVPIRYGTGYDDPWSDIPTYHVPADFYYAELNSNWNVDSDTLLGEKHCNMDYKAELSVGRILCTTTQEIHNYTDKLLLYDCNPGRGDFSYLRKALLTQSDGMQALNEANIIAEEIADMFPDTTIISELPSYYDDNPIFPSGIDIIQEMNKNYGYVTWINHGEPPFIVTKSTDYGFYYKSAITSIDTFQTSMIEEGNNCGLNLLENKNYPMIAYSIACNTAAFDNYKKEYFGNYLNFARSFTTGKEYGGPALIGNTRVGFEEYTYLVQQCFNSHIAKHNIGESLNLAKLYNIDNDGRHHHSLTINIIGCPDLNIWTTMPQMQKATIEYGQNNIAITPIEYSDSTYVSIYPLNKNKKAYSIPANFANGLMSISEAENSLITLTGRNCLPWISPLYLQNTSISGDNYIQVSDIYAGNNVRNGEHGHVVFESGSNTNIEKTGTVTLSKGVTIEKGAQIMITNSSIRK